MHPRASSRRLGFEALEPRTLLSAVIPSTASTLPSQSKPRITSTAVTSAVVGQAYSYLLKIAASAAQKITFTLKTAPAGMTIGQTSGLVNWKPSSSQVGANSVTVVASDQYGNSTRQTFTINVLRAFSIVVPSPTVPIKTALQPNAVSSPFTVGLNQWWL